ncbi:polyprenyl synthetase [Ancylostoma duodenale]|uniref:Polyprenyl synthetase n=1 Tax=Ancylostoma duodenale TaxID=51022 RepID=A0A0C2H3L1_9BILA|nr:polyprenyl synthetase [Ancylostoma duodenale]
MAAKSNGNSASVDEEHLLAPFDYITSMPGKQAQIVQMLHNASLMIDDIEDNSVLRRGLPVTHHIYGTPRTINTANYVYFIALDKCTRNVFHYKRSSQYTQSEYLLTEQMLELHRGQGKELFWRDTVTCPTEAEYEEMVIQKTGGLFFLAVRLIELFSEEDYDFANLLRQMSLFFQIRDDYLNLVSDDMTKQKSFAEDLTEGKFSYPIIHAIRSSPTSSNDDPVLNILRQRTEDIEVKKYCINVIRERKSFDRTLVRLRAISAQIRSEITALGGNSKLEEVMDLLERGIIE